MAVEEVEYYSLHNGNGVSGGVRQGKAVPAQKKKYTGKSSGASSSYTSFLQGITLGAVLLIPVGVWCWVRVAEGNAPVVEVQENQVKKAANKGGKAAAAAGKKKPMRMSGAAAAPRVRESGPKAALAVPEAPPAGVGYPPPAAPVIGQLPRLPDDTELEGPKQKKGVWKTLAAPFRGKVKPAQGEPEEL